MKAYNSLSCESWNALQDTLRALCDDIENRVIPLQKESGKECTYVRIEIWEDTGRVIAFPAASLEDRIDVAGSQVQCQSIADDILALDQSGLDDDAYENAVNDIICRIGNTVHTVFENTASFPYKVFSQDGNSI
ncbi:hypothetical protein [Vibrio sp. HB161653]|uniref:hypothetical protein n=1 Tax=Vibrio sp. HB161653 TaxID=3068274 RepID=UPI00273F6E3C|nr:hypothetical protein [Vibrio sp. HB161653]MDP5255839.1 hypothetical protein [Vibrio sp. HB161653]